MSPSRRGHQGWAGVGPGASRITGAPHSFQAVSVSDVVPFSGCPVSGCPGRPVSRSLETLTDHSQGLWFQILRPSRLLICTADST